MTIPENAYLYINIFIVALYLVLMFFAYSKGFLYETVNMLYTLFSLAVAWFVSPVLAKLFPIIGIGKIDEQYEMLNSIIDFDKIINTAAYFIIVFLVMKVIYIFISLLTKSLNKIPVLGKFNKIMGLFVGFVNATIIVFALSMLLSLPLFKNGREVKDHTFFKYIEKYTIKAVTYVAEKIALNEEGMNFDSFDIKAYQQEFSDWLESISRNE